MKVTLVGAGSHVFTRNLCNDIMLNPALEGCRLVLMDIDPDALRRSHDLVRAIAERRSSTVTVEATTDRRAALRGADHVITTFQQGGLEAYRLDIEIPAAYGVEQCVGDTLGPGGVFRALRTIPVLLDICRDLDEVAPDALLINYVNPMAANCWAVARATGRPAIGLCHSVQGTSELLAGWAGVPHDELTYLAAGINHQAFFLELRHRGVDLYPAIRAAAQDPEVRGSEPVRIELMRSLGWFVTESSGHASEYVPWFRKTAAMVEEDLVPRFTNPLDRWFDHGRTGGYLRWCERVRSEEGEPQHEHIGDLASVSDEPSHEYGSHLIAAIETHDPIIINANVVNAGLIDNLPAGCVVEVPCLVDGNGPQGVHVNDYPTVLAALNRTAINVQELVVEAALEGDRDAVHHAVMLDPLTAAVCTLPQIHSMVGELLERQARWLGGGLAR